MFAWLGKWFGKGMGHGVFSPRQRCIYSYFNGQQMVKADPMVLYRLLMDKGPELAIDIKVAGSMSKDAAKAHKEMVQKITGIFAIKSLEEGGLSEIEAIALLDHFLAYVEQVKKNGPLPMTSQEGTSPSFVPTPDTSQATPNVSPSGSTASGPSTARPEPLPSVLVSP